MRLPLRLFTDGACSSNGKPNAFGGSAWTMWVDDVIVGAGAKQLKNATNNICELTAVIDACEVANKIVQNSFSEKVEIYCDSAYIINCVNDGWWEKWICNGWVNSKKQPVANQDLWEKLIPYFKKPNFKFIKVKGHSNIKENELTDKIAVAAKKGIFYSEDEIIDESIYY